MKQSKMKFATPRLLRKANIGRGNDQTVLALETRVWLQSAEGLALQLQ